jgi:hypothetical protein
MDKRAGHRDGRSADAASAMDANALPGAKAGRQSGHKASEGGSVGRNLSIGNWERQKLQSYILCKNAFFAEGK